MRASALLNRWLKICKEKFQLNVEDLHLPYPHPKWGTQSWSYMLIKDMERTNLLFAERPVKTLTGYFYRNVLRRRSFFDHFSHHHDYSRKVYLYKLLKTRGITKLLIPECGPCGFEILVAKMAGVKEVHTYDVEKSFIDSCKELYGSDFASYSVSSTKDFNFQPYFDNGFFVIRPDWPHDDLIAKLKDYPKTIVYSDPNDFSFHLKNLTLQDFRDFAEAQSALKIPTLETNLKIGLYLDSEPYGGGVYQYVLTWVEALDKLKCEVQVIATHERWQSLFKAKGWKTEIIPNQDKWIWKALRLHLLPVSLWRSVSSQLHPLAKAIKSAHCDAWVFPAQDHWTFQVAGERCLGTVHDLMHIYQPEFEEVKLHARSRNFIFGNMSKYASGILVDSELGKKHVVESYGTDPQKVFVLPYLPPDYVTGLRDKPVTKTLPLPEKFIFYPAQFWSHKNHKNLFLAIDLLKEKYSDIHLVCAGSDKNASSEAKQILKDKNLGNHITILGYVENEKIVELYKRAVAMVMPTFFGPTNIPPLEAMYLGCPSALSDIYAMPERSENAALYFDPYKPESIASAIEKYWTNENLRQEKIQEGFKQLQKWTPAHFQNKVSEILTAVTKIDPL
jgi:glycosyltransferase involved in cell wall biosynthesis